MATQKTTVVVDVVDNGSTEKLNQQAQKTHKSFKDLAKTAGSIVVGGAKQALSLARPSTRLESSSIMSEAQYGAARGSAGLTGASARDFAKQAEGLSGLVRLYATYAANIYAAGAAFRALSQAMDTANMVQGLDQLGAASGMALGSLSKRLVAATDGAIALRDAMEATVKASSSGMDSSQILRMGKAAKLASQALGVDMNDAVSRITRGITKLEPELLDELGLFIKVDDVVKNYAQSVGKSASAVTDFEKRQAVANAVLTQAEEKFSAINIDTNPYTKLAATMKDLAQAGLELVNKVLAPIAGYLAESPVALATGMAAFVALIVKQAIPAITQYRESILASTEEAVKASASKYAVAKKYLNLETAELKAAADREAEESHNRFEEASNRILKSYQDSAGKTKGLSKEVAAIAAKNASDISEADLKIIDSYANAGTKRSQVYRDFADSIREYRTLAEDSEGAIAKIEAKRLADSEALNKSFAESNKRNLQDMYSSNIRAQAAYTASTKGFVAAIKEAVDMQKRLKEGTAEVKFEMEELDSSGKKVTKTITEKIPASTKVGAAFAGLSGIFAATATTVGGLVSKLGHIGEAVGIAVAVGGLMYAWLTNTSKQASETSKSIQILDSSIENVGRTLEAIAKKPTQLRFDVQSISAAATAVSDLGTQLVDSFEKSYAEIEAMNWADKIVDAVMPGSVEGRLASRVASSVDTAFKAVSADSPAAKKAKEAIQSALKLDPKAVLSATNIEKALDGLSDSQRKNALESVSNAIKTLGKEMQITAARGSELVAGFKKLEDSRQKLATSFVPKDEFSQYGQDLVDTSVKLGAALTDPVQKYNALVQLANEYPKVAGATAGTAILLQDLASDVAQLNNASARYAASQEKLAKIESDLNNLIGKERAKAILEGRKIQISGLTAAGIDQLNQLRSALQGVREDSKAASDIQVQVRLRIEQAQEVISKAQLDVFKSGAELVSASLSAEWAKAGSTIANAYANILSGTETGIRLRAESEKAVIAAQIAQIQSQRNLMISNQRLAIAIERETIERLKQNAGTIEREYVIAPREAALNAREAELSQVEAGKSTKGMYKNLADELGSGKRQMTDLDTASLSFARNMEASGAAIANLNAQIAAVDISMKDQLLAEQFKKRKEDLEAQNKLLGEQRAALDTVKSAMGVYNEQYILEKQRLETRQREIAQATEMMAIEAEIARYKQKGVAERAGPEIARAEAKKAELLATQQLQSLTLKITQAQERAVGAIDAAAEARKKQAEEQSKERQILQDSLSTRTTLLDLGKEVGAYTEKEYLTQKYLLDVEKAKLDYAEKLASSRESSATKLEDLSKREATIREAVRVSNREYTAAEVSELAKIEQARLRINTTQKESEVSANTVLQTNLTNLEALKQVNVQQAEWNQRLEAVKVFGEGIKALFEGLGESFASGLSAVASALAETATLADKNAAAIERFGKAGDEAFNKAMNASSAEEALRYSEEATEAWNNQSKARKKAEKDEISGYAKTAGAAKGMFKEKTAAHKAFAAVEKVLHIARLAMDIKEMVSNGAATATKIANDGMAMASDVASATVSGAKAVIKAISDLPFPANIAAGAATAAVVGAILSSIGGSGPNVSNAGFTPTSEQLQEVQGTGTTYNAKGEKVADAGGIFGDDEAKANSIVKSLEILRDNSFESLDYDNKLLRSFENISNAIGKAVNVAVTSGLRTIPDELALTLGSFEDKFSGTGIGLVDSIIGGILGGDYSESRTLQNRRLELRGTFDSVSKDMANGLKLVTDILVKWEEDGGWLGDDDSGSYIQTLTENAKPDIVEAFDEIFGYFKEGYVALAEKIGKDNPIEFVASRLKSVNLVDSQGQPLKLDLTGLTSADEIRAEMDAYFSKINNITLKALFPEFKAFETAGEDYGTTVARVVQGNNQVKLALLSMGSDFDITADRTTTLTTTLRFFGVSLGTITTTVGKSSYQISEDLIKLAGGLDNFTDRAKFFTQNFLTEEEQLAPVSASVSKELKRLAEAGYTSADGLVDTREEFKLLVQGLDLATTGGQEAYTALMKLAPGFDRMIEPAEELAASIKSERDSLELELERVKLLGDTVALRELEISKLDESNRAIKREIYYWEDLKTARDDAINKLGSMVTTFRDFAKQVNTFRASLLLGSTSTATPLEKLATAQTEFETTYKKAITGDKDAMSKLTSSASTYLDTAKTVFASSTEYSNIFSSVVDKLTTAESVAATTADTAELQLNALKDQTILLQNIDAGIAKIAGIGPAPIQTAATGGWRQGITLVGEEGPELVDFKTPARVYTTDQTNGMLSAPVAAANQQQALIAEVRALRKEVVKLREQQRTETGHLINATYDAQTRNADIITDELATNMSRLAWKQQVSQTAVVK